MELGRGRQRERRHAKLSISLPLSAFYLATYLPPAGASTTNPTAKEHCLMKVEADEREKHCKSCSAENRQFLNRVKDRGLVTTRPNVLLNSV